MWRYGGKGLHSAVKALPAPKMHQHHIFPVQFIKKFRRAGIDIDQYTVPISDTLHLQGVHGKGGFVGVAGDLPGYWNNEWAAFLKPGSYRSREDMYRFAGYLMDRYGLSHLPIGPLKR